MANGMSANLGTAAIRVVANTTEFDYRLRRSLRNVTAAAVGVGVALTAINIASSAVRNAIELERVMGRLSTIVSEADMTNLFSTEQIRAVSDEIGIAAKDVAQGLYDVTAAGVDASQAMESVSVASKLARATNSDLRLVLDFTTTALNAYGDAGMTATQANDLLFEALKYGKGTMNDFAKYISTAISTADGLGASLEELSGLAAVSTLTGSSARKVFTGLRSAMEELSDDTKGAGKVFKEEFGENFQTYMKEGGTLLEGFAKLVKRVGATNLTAIFGKDYGAQALSILAQMGPEVEAVVRAVENSSGSVEEASNKIEKTLGYQIDQLKVRWNNYIGALGDALGPATASALGGLISFFDGIQRGVEGVIAGYQGLLGFYREHEGILRALAAAVAVLTFAYYANIAAQKIMLTYISMQILLQGGLRKAIYETQFALYALTVAIKRNPWGLASVAIMAALAAVYAYTGSMKAVANVIISVVNPVIQVFNLSLGGTILALASIYDALRLVAVGFLNMYKGALKVVGIIPIIGDNADEAARETDGWIDAINGVSASLDNLHKQAQVPIIQKFAIVDVSADPTGMSGPAWELQGEALNQELQRQIDVNNMENAQKKLDQMMKGIDWGGGGGGYSGSAGGGGGGSSAKDAAQRMRDLMKQVWEDVKVIAKDTGKQSVDEIKRNFEALFKDMGEAKLPKSLMNRAKKVRASLIKIAKKRDEVIKKLEIKKQERDALQGQWDSMFKGIQDSFRSFGNITNDTGGIGVTFTGMRNIMRKAIAEGKQFADAMKKLMALGLNKTALQQLIDAGPEAGRRQAMILAQGGAAAVNEINNLQGQLTAVADPFAKAASDHFYQAGIQSANGIIAGLQAQEKALTSQMERMGDKMAKAFKKALGIKSPSSVFAGLGEMIPAGLAKGMDAGEYAVNRSARNMMGTVINMGGIEVNGVSDPKAARRAGIMTGAAVSSTLQRQNIANQLGGL